MGGTFIFLQLLGSVTLLLWGVRMVRTGMTRAFGAWLRRIMTMSSRSRFTAFGAGLAVTGLLQSSTATTLVLASFAGRGLVTLPVALAMVLGADVGTTVAAQIFSFELKALWSVFLAVGFLLFSASDRDRLRHAGRILMGIGMMLLALIHIGSAAEVLREAPLFGLILRSISDEPLFAFLLAAAVTWLAHSSLSIILFLATLAGAGAISIPFTLAMVLGANVGGSFAAFITLLGSTPSARRVAAGNLIMRFLSAAVVLMLIVPSASWLAVIESAPARLVVNFHTAYNLVTALVFLGLLGPVAWLSERLLPDQPQQLDATRPRHLDQNALDNPSEALACALRETLSLGDRVADMLNKALVVIEVSDSRLAREVEKADDVIDSIYEAIKLYLVQITRNELSEDESRRHVEILTFVTNLEHVGDIIDKNLMELASKKIRNRLTFSDEGIGDIRRFHTRIVDNMRLALNVFATRDLVLARRLVAEKAAVRAAELDAAERHYARLKQGRPESIETSSIHLDVIRDLKRINGHLTSVAYPILETAGELSESRLRQQNDEPTTIGAAPAEN